jgi:hypothetical protein
VRLVGLGKLKNVMTSPRIETAIVHNSVKHKIQKSVNHVNNSILLWKSVGTFPINEVHEEDKLHYLQNRSWVHHSLLGQFEDIFSIIIIEIISWPISRLHSVTL